MKNLFKLILCALIAGGTFTGCSSDESLNDGKATGENANMTVRLVDGPGDYEKVLIDVQQVEVIIDGEIVELDTNAGIYDLLTLTGGEFVTLVNEDIPTGLLSQMRLKLGTENSLVLNDGTEVDLITPAAQQVGLILVVNYEIEADVQYDFIMDFMVDRSVIELPGRSEYLLQPVIRVITAAESGSIRGSVEPADVLTLVTATNNADSSIEVTAFTDPISGDYLLYGVPEGEYTVVLEPKGDNEFSPVTIENVQVEIGVTTTLETVVFE